MNNNQDKYKHVLPEYFCLKEIATACGYADTSLLRRYCSNGRLFSVKIEDLRLVPTTQAVDFMNEILENK